MHKTKVLIAWLTLSFFLSLSLFHKFKEGNCNSSQWIMKEDFKVFSSEWTSSEKCDRGTLGVGTFERGNQQPCQWECF